MVWYLFCMVLVRFGMAVVWCWYGFDMVLVWFWYGFGMGVCIVVVMVLV